MTKYRDHCASLRESMETVVEFRFLEELVDYLRMRGPSLGFPFNVVNEKNIRIEPICSYDGRNGWSDLHIVIIEGIAVGYTEGSVKRNNLIEFHQPIPKLILAIDDDAPYVFEEKPVCKKDAGWNVEVFKSAK